VIGIIIPAHDEARVIGRLLGPLVAEAHSDELDVLVVANGCSDDTAEVAAGFGSPVRVISLAVASKREALLAGNEALRDYPRIYVDADVEIDVDSIRALDKALSVPGVLVTAPVRVLAVEGRAWPIRRYYDVWTRLPEVKRGLFGRGVIAVGEEGHERIASLPAVLADDLAASMVFGPHERAVVPGAQVVIHPPRTISDLLRRRIRAAEGVAQIEQMAKAPGPSARTRPSDLLTLLRSEPRLAPAVAIFLGVAVAARLGARRRIRRRDYSTWLRDESSRQ
jgi:glycosyltransferase involved in cell wall biosynthesis